ncbi:uncharacterized protein LOC133798634 [Humulus lupulus]|uniref:uncharacterized protein LOC133798634 n=1 Tax=Humulus lupulus TaxID=3486 RepID=UPI002B414F75|nr:uncharacterized protein LOC133798634 [Humulus lupulus]
MALWMNTAVLFKHHNYGGPFPWAVSSSYSSGVVCVNGSWRNTFSFAMKSSTSSQASLWSSVSFSDKRPVKANSENHEQRQEEDEEEDYQVLTSIRSNYNDIMILDTAKAKILLLDSSYNVHSILYKHQKWTNSYWDEFASLPPIVPQGPIAILGLGGGTVAHLMLDLWPKLQLEGWEIDQILIDKAREHFALSDLEKHTNAGGMLTVHVGDAFSPSINVTGRYAGVVVDLFSNGEVLPQLQEVPTWLNLNNWLMPGGRIMVNCGGTSGASEVDLKTSSDNVSWMQNSTINALSTAFPEQISWKKLGKENGANYLALTGPIPDLESWSTMVPEPLSNSVREWKPYEES